MLCLKEQLALLIKLKRDISPIFDWPEKSFKKPRKSPRICPHLRLNAGAGYEPDTDLSFRPIAANDAGQKIFNSQFGAQAVSFAAVTEPKDISRQSESSLRGFWSLFVTQFQGAFSDNILKNLVVFMLVALDVSLAEKHKIGELVGALFSLPFILFSMAGGFLADRFSKRTITIGVKIFEVFVMLSAIAGFMWQQNLANAGVVMSWRTCAPLLGCVFLMGAHSAFFGPSKYGLLPELLPEKKLSWGNGLLELGTFTAIILGTVAAALMAKHFHGRQIWSGVILVVLAFVGLTTSLGITRVPAADPAKKFRANFVGDLWGRLRAIRQDRPLALAALGNTYFNFLGALLLLNLFFYGADVLRVDETKIGLLNVALALGIGLGSAAAGCLSGGKIEYGLVPLGAFGMSLACALLSVPDLSVNAALVRLALLGFAGGFFIVPVCALLQHRPDPAKKRRSAGGGKPAFVRRRVSGVRRTLFAGATGGFDAAADFSFWRGADAGGRDFCARAFARIPGARLSLAGDAHVLPGSRAQRGECPAPGRGVARQQSHFLRGLAAIDGGGGSVGAFSHGPGILRFAVDQALRPHRAGHSDSFRSPPA